MDKFDKIYSETVKDVSINNREKSYEIIQLKENQEKINELCKILEDIKAVVPTDRRILYVSFKLKYDNLLYLTEISRRKDNLSMDEDFKARLILSTIQSEKDKQ